MPRAAGSGSEPSSGRRGAGPFGPLLVIPLAAAALAAGCGGGGGTTTTAEVDGATVFATNECGMCHHFTAAASEGDIGPDLDLTTMTAEQVELQVREGTGTMPGYKFTLTDEEIAAVVAFVVENRPP